jgi:hypothetical protein
MPGRPPVTTIPGQQAPPGWNRLSKPLPRQGIPPAPRLRRINQLPVSGLLPRQEIHLAPRLRQPRQGIPRLLRPKQDLPLQARHRHLLSMDRLPEGPLRLHQPRQGPIPASRLRQEMCRPHPAGMGTHPIRHPCLSSLRDPGQNPAFPVTLRKDHPIRQRGHRTPIS